VTGRALRYAAFGTVAAQGVLLVVFFTVPKGDDWAVAGWLSGITSAVQIAGWAVLLVALVNLGRSLTALPTPTERSTLKTTGLYRFARHPIYTGLLAIVLGGALGSGRTVKMLLALALLGLLTAKARWRKTCCAAVTPTTTTTPPARPASSRARPTEHESPEQHGDFKIVSARDVRPSGV
jgi:protein-S-isoprenylcysteine O-methyltransferase Ste14